MSREVLAEGLFTHRAQPFIRAVCVGDDGVRWFPCVWYLRLLIDSVTPLFIHYRTHNLFMPCSVFFYSLWQFS